MAVNLHALANPARFRRWSRHILPIAAGIALLTGISGLYFGLFKSPADYQQSETVRIMYVHAPSAWMAMFSYAMLALFGVFALVWKHPLGEVAGQACAPIGVCFTALTLATGALWGEPMWGAWWAWDARMTSVLILFFLFLGYLALSHAFDDPQRGARVSAILAIMGVVILPIIKFSVDWWNTLHQPASVIRLDGPSIDGSMLLPLLLMAVAFKALFVVLLVVRIRAGLAERKLQSLYRLQVRTAKTPGAVPESGR